jgi:PhnB protein
MSVITIHMVVRDAAAASSWYVAVFGAEERSRIVLPDGRLIHVELSVGGSMLMLADEFPEHGAVAPADGAPSPTAFYLTFPDVDVVWTRALDMGATEHRPLQDTPFGERDGQIIDPFGYRWGLTQHLTDVSLDEMTEAAAAMFRKDG